MSINGDSPRWTRSFRDMRQPPTTMTRRRISEHSSMHLMFGTAARSLSDKNGGHKMAEAPLIFYANEDRDSCALDLLYKHLFTLDVVPDRVMLHANRAGGHL